MRTMARPAAPLLLLSLCSLAAGKVRFPDEGRLSHGMAVADGCPCDDKTLCNPVQVQHEKEVFGYTAGSTQVQWDHLDWSQVTTLAWTPYTELVCLAHTHNVRLISGAISVNTTFLNQVAADPSVMDGYIAETIRLVRGKYLDGVTFDYEDPLPPGSPAAAAYATLIGATRDALHEAVPGSQVSTAVAWGTDNIDGRYYPLVDMAEASDLLYIMMYDTRSQILDQCIASANAAIARVEHGVQQYLDLGISPKQLVLGVPWYGYDYPCLEGTAVDAAYCPIKEVPFRGVNCSDAAGREVPFNNIMAQLNGNTTATGYRFEHGLGTPFFNYVAEDGVVHQVWFDDPTSLRMKYQVAVKHGLRGTGPFTYSDLGPWDTEQQQQQADAMWDALKVFTRS